MKILYLLLGACISVTSNAVDNSMVNQIQQTRPISPHIITFFVEPYEEQPTKDQQKIQKVIETPGKLNHTILKKRLLNTRNQGLYATYFGFVTHSDANGQVTFPRKHLKDEITFVVTQRIKPVMLKGNTVHHFDLGATIDAAYYQLVRKQDSSKKFFYWDAKKIDIPTNRRIPISAIVLFAKPDNVIMYEGATVTDNNQNLVLPPIYVKPTITTGINALAFLKISKYFRPIKFVYNYTPERYATMIKP